MTSCKLDNNTVEIIPKLSGKRILLVTIFAAPERNLGNTLQHYALQEILRDYEFEVDSVLCPLQEPPDIYEKIIIKLANMKNFIIGNFKRVFKLLLALAGVKKYREKLMRKIKDVHVQPVIININMTDRNEIFDKFYRAYITGIFHATYREVLKSNKSRWEKYNFAVTGSDQVWNKDIVETREALKFYYLYFIERKKRINYAPSFGRGEIKFYDRYLHKKCLMGFNELSCREKSGCELIKSLTGRYAQLVLDPTLLLNADDWRKISRKPDYELPKRYALAYFFEIPEKYKFVINHVLESENLELIDIFNPSDKLHYLTGPQEFIYLFDHAEFIFTGSFHGTAFSVNFEKKFIAFGENDNRIESILSTLGIENSIYKQDREIPSCEINYNEVNEKLNALRKSSRKYLGECLNCDDIISLENKKGA